MCASARYNHYEQCTEEIRAADTFSAVADSIVDTFLATLTAEEGMEAVANAFVRHCSNTTHYSEASLRSALFDEGTP